MRRRTSEAYVCTLPNDDFGQASYDMIRRALKATHKVYRCGRGKNRLEKFLTWKQCTENLSVPEIRKKYTPCFHTLEQRLAQKLPIEISTTYDVYATLK